MLEVGDQIPGTMTVWTQPGESPQTLAEALGPGLVLLCFYLFDLLLT